MSGLFTDAYGQGRLAPTRRASESAGAIERATESWKQARPAERGPALTRLLARPDVLVFFSAYKGSREPAEVVRCSEGLGLDLTAGDLGLLIWAGLGRSS